MIKNFFGSLGLLVSGIVMLIVSISLHLTLDTTLFIVLMVVSLLLLLSGLYELVKALQGGKSDENTNGMQTITAEYSRKKSLMTNPEWELYQLLKSILPRDRFEVLPQMALVNVVDKVTQNSFRNELFRIIDFCIISAKSSAPLLLIELNDASHSRFDRIERDRKVAEICSRAKMPIVSFTLAQAKDTHYIKKTIQRNMLK